MPPRHRCSNKADQVLFMGTEFAINDIIVTVQAQMVRNANDRHRGTCSHRITSSSGRKGLLWLPGCVMMKEPRSWTSQESWHWGTG
jgi:hypothetical protein